MNKNIYLVTSNEIKLKEFKRFGLEGINIEKGRNLDEVDGSPQEVVLYKAIEAGKGRIVEDTSLHIQGESVGVNIRWVIDNLDQFNGKKAVWEVLLGYNNGSEVELYQGLIKGVLTNKTDKDEKGFGFDQYFIPNGQDRTLHQLEKAGMKDFFSARKNAVINLMIESMMNRFEIKNVPAWTGKMQ